MDKKLEMKVEEFHWAPGIPGKRLKVQYHGNLNRRQWSTYLDWLSKNYDFDKVEFVVDEWPRRERYVGTKDDIKNVLWYWGSDLTPESQGYPVTLENLMADLALDEIEKMKQELKNEKGQ